MSLAGCRFQYFPRWAADIVQPRDYGVATAKAEGLAGQLQRALCASRLQYDDALTVESGLA